ncbi:histidine-type phosphatase [Xanthomonas translucens]|uniref:Histidine acid phosphatase n=3 Tax=Xanthomonas campestris pv. translucens TaxID=343 RepID=A0A109HLD4_XANCT|nr:histidine-type phosphatase [Xanthomonas translucens]KWV14096.1 histidine acid phosphatase [Xanthomonas translucens]QEO27956.1 histidine-type phosphatase [Xanthomonas translucens pv. undulosa]QSQ33122.1 histidine-type phosphatase [Xanthomonas translucens pv. translucens]UJB14903.1 histidine-type phosphatase [Xanthomonas translucens pv. undulosa]
MHVSIEVPRTATLARRRLHRVAALLLLAAAALPAAAARVPTGTAVRAGANPPAQVRLSIVVMRHGVRAPTKDPQALARYAAQPWPQWPVAPGMLTAHGTAGMQALGARYRQRWLGEGLLAPGCDAAQVVLIADSTPRNHASAAAFGEGLQPGCHAHYLALPTTQNNPLFHYAAGEDKSDDKGDDAVAAPLHPDAATRARLRALQRVLSGCQGAACPAQVPGQDTPRLDDPQRLDDPAQAAKLLKTAGSLAENLMLEYAQGLPLAQVAWGRADAAALQRLIGLHNAAFDHSKRALPAARAGGSNLLAHLLATLQAAAGQTPAVAPLAPAQTRALLLLGHDTNLAHLAGLLDVPCAVPEQPDAYPPGGALLLELVRQGGRDYLQLRSVVPTLQALRDNRFDGAALRERRWPLPGCGGRLRCPLAVALPALQARLDAQQVQAEVPTMRAWPVQAAGGGD